MEKRIIYKNADGELVIVIPAAEAVEAIGIEAIAQKDVPAGLPYKIVDAEVIPQDRTFRAAWSIEDSELVDGVGADFGNGTLWGVVGFSEDSVLIRHQQTGEEKIVSIRQPQAGEERTIAL